MIESRTGLDPTMTEMGARYFRQRKEAAAPSVVAKVSEADQAGPAHVLTAEPTSNGTSELASSAGILEFSADDITDTALGSPAQEPASIVQPVRHVEPAPAPVADQAAQPQDLPAARNSEITAFIRDQGLDLTEAEDRNLALVEDDQAALHDLGTLTYWRDVLEARKAKIRQDNNLAQFDLVPGDNPAVVATIDAVDAHTAQGNSDAAANTPTETTSTTATEVPAATVPVTQGEALSASTQTAAPSTEAAPVTPTEKKVNTTTAPEAPAERDELQTYIAAENYILLHIDELTTQAVGAPLPDMLVLIQMRINSLKRTNNEQVPTEINPGIRLLAGDIQTYMMLVATIYPNQNFGREVSKQYEQLYGTLPPIDTEIKKNLSEVRAILGDLLRLSSYFKSEIAILRQRRMISHTQSSEILKLVTDLEVTVKNKQPSPEIIAAQFNDSFDLIEALKDIPLKLVRDKKKIDSGLPQYIDDLMKDNEVYQLEKSALQDMAQYRDQFTDEQWNALLQMTEKEEPYLKQFLKHMIFNKATGAGFGLSVSINLGLAFAAHHGINLAAYGVDQQSIGAARQFFYATYASLTAGGLNLGAKLLGGAMARQTRSRFVQRIGVGLFDFADNGKNGLAFAQKFLNGFALASGLNMIVPDMYNNFVETVENPELHASIAQAATQFKETAGETISNLGETVGNWGEAIQDKYQDLTEQNHGFTNLVTVTPTATETNVPTLVPTETQAAAVSTPQPTETTEASVTPTTTATSTATGTATSHPTFTSTPTSTETSHPPTATASPTETHTATATETAVPTLTSTPTATETQIPSPTATNTPVPTETATLTPTATNTPDAIATPTYTPEPLQPPSAAPIVPEVVTGEVTVDGHAYILDHDANGDGIAGAGDVLIDTTDGSKHFIGANHVGVIHQSDLIDLRNPGETLKPVEVTIDGKTYTLDHDANKDGIAGAGDVLIDTADGSKHFIGANHVGAIHQSDLIDLPNPGEFQTSLEKAAQYELPDSMSDFKYGQVVIPASDGSVWIVQHMSETADPNQVTEGDYAFHVQYVTEGTPHFEVVSQGVVVSDPATALPERFGGTPLDHVVTEGFSMVEVGDVDPGHPAINLPVNEAIGEAVSSASSAVKDLIGKAAETIDSVTAKPEEAPVAEKGIKVGELTPNQPEQSTTEAEQPPQNLNNGTINDSGEGIQAVQDAQHTSNDGLKVDDHGAAVRAVQDARAEQPTNAQRVQEIIESIDKSTTDNSQPSKAEVLQESREQQSDAVANANSSDTPAASEAKEVATPVAAPEIEAAAPELQTHDFGYDSLSQAIDQGLDGHYQTDANGFIIHNGETTTVTEQTLNDSIKDFWQAANIQMAEAQDRDFQTIGTGMDMIDASKFSTMAEMMEYAQAHPDVMGFELSDTQIQALGDHFLEAYTTENPTAIQQVFREHFNALPNVGGQGTASAWDSDVIADKAPQALKYLFGVATNASVSQLETAARIEANGIIN